MLVGGHSHIRQMRYILGLILCHCNNIGFISSSSAYCNLNSLRWNPKQQLRVTLDGYFTIHLNTVNVIAPFRQNVNFSCDVIRSQRKANTTEILRKTVYVIILATPHSINNRNSVDYKLLLWIGKPIIWFDEQPDHLVLLRLVIQRPSPTC